MPRKILYMYMYANITNIDTVCKDCCLLMYFFQIIQLHQIPIFKCTTSDIRVL